MKRAGTAMGALRVFFKLGVSSFGGPIAHIGYFREEFVVRRRWLDEQAFADLVALCQFLPGPASSQLAFSIGLMRAGYRGALAAWTGFTLPSAIALTLFAFQAPRLAGPQGIGLLHGLQLVAVPVVAQAIWGMARTFCASATRAALALSAALITSCAHSWIGQISTITLAGLCGAWILPREVPTAHRAAATPSVTPRAALVALALFAFLLVGVPLINRLVASNGLSEFDAFYRSGALVFGGGHVVLPLLREAFVTPGWVSDEAFLAGYGAAQAVPGPLFTFAAYLGAVSREPPGGIAGAALGLVAIFLPGMLLLTGALPFWRKLRSNIVARAALGGINAAVVGVLAAALYNPILVSSIGSPLDVALALGGWLALQLTWMRPWVLALLFASTGMLFATR